MVRSLLSLVGREIRGMHQAAYLLAGFALLSQLLALVRDRLLAATFGASHTLDLYYAAFRIPDMLFATVASLLSLYALLPVLTRFDDERHMVAFVREALLLFFVAMGAISGVVFVVAPVLVPLVAPGIASPALILLVRILLLQPILLGASNIIAALTQLQHRFVLYSISPLLYNVGIIFGIVVLYPWMGLSGLAWGVVCGALLHLCVQLPYFKGLRVRAASFGWRATMVRMREVLVLSVPRTAALAAGQVSLLALVAMASLFAPGSIAIFTLAYNLQAVPLTIIGVSYSVAAFPTLSRLYSAGQSNEFAQHIEVALRHIVFWAIPTTVFMIVLRAQLVRVILGAGQFDWSATRITAAALALFILSLVAQSVTLLIMRAYYAAGETRKPLYRGIVDIIVSIGSALLLVGLFHSSAFMRDFIEALLRVSDIPGTTVLMLALGYTLGAVAQCVVGLMLFLRSFAVPTRRLTKLIGQSLSASIIGGAICYAVLSYLGATGNIAHTGQVFVEGFLAGAVGLCTTAVVLWLLGNEEIAETYRTLHARLAPAPVVLEPTDVSNI